MDSKSPQNAPRKHKFKPRAPPLPVPKAEVKTEKLEEVDGRATDLMRQFHERSIKSKAKVEKKLNASQIAFGTGAASTSLKSYGVPKARGFSADGSHSSVLKDDEYQEPWDYYTNYPSTLPLRRPYSGNPAVLDKEEFGDGSESAVYDENATTSAAELGLLSQGASILFVIPIFTQAKEAVLFREVRLRYFFLSLFFPQLHCFGWQEENVEPRMFLLQLPPTMPMVKQSGTASSSDVKPKSKPQGTCRFDELPSGYMGKMLVYKNGDVKLKLGDTIYDVSPGMKCVFAQDVVAVNTVEKHCCVFGEVERRVILTPDIDSMPDL